MVAGAGAPWAPPLVELTGGMTGHLLAWEVLARKTLPSDVSAWPEPARPLGYTGTALGLLDRTK